MRDELPPYLEAFPMLDLAARGWADQRDIVWHEIPEGQVGRAITVIEKYTMRITYDFNQLWFTPPVSGTYYLSVEPRYSASGGPTRLLGLCHGCATYVSRLFFRNVGWLCKDCQGLRNRSTYLTADERRSEQLSALRREIGEGRPPGMSERTYQKRLARRDDLRELLGTRWKLPDHRFSRWMRDEWLDA